MMNLEIERKFLVAGEFRQYASKAVRISQGYISSSPGRTVRVRIWGDQGFLTIKARGNGISRFEWEKEITLDDAHSLMLLCGKGRIDKTRYLVEYMGHTFEVDEFYGDNEGLVMAEVELSSEDEHFEKPSWLGEEVTGDARYYNSNLIRNPFSKW